ncbi:MAG: hypothetical protein WEE64_05335 [Dehalococcoidia bacterium]
MGVYFISKDGATLRHIVEGDVFHADLSPDGTEVVYQRDNQVVATDIASGTTRVIVPQPADGQVYGPAWSATGRYVSYYLYGEDGTREARIVHRNGTGSRPLIAGGRLEVGIKDWLPDDSAAIVISNRPAPSAPADPRHYHIQTVTADGIASPSLATFEPCGCGGGPAFQVLASPDGKRFAYSDETGGVFVANIDGTDLRDVTQTKQGDLMGWVDDQTLAFRAFREGEAAPFGSAYRLDLTSGTATPARLSLAVAPDGSAVKDFLWRCAVPSWLFFQTPDGSEREMLRGRIPGEWWLSDAEWLPDGSGLVFTVTRHDVCV